MKSLILYTHSKRFVLTRVAWSSGLSALLLLFGSFVLAFAVMRTVPVQNRVRSAETMTFHIEGQLTAAVSLGATPTSSSPPDMTISTAVLVYSRQTQVQAPPQASVSLISHGNARLPEIALTFDDGPSPLYTQQILAILQRYAVKATFFCVGRQVQAYPARVRQEYAAGHVIGNHTWSHPYLPSLSRAAITWQLSATSDDIARATGIRPVFFRPPYGAFNSQVLSSAHALGLATVLWDVDPRDWSRPGPTIIATRVLSQVHNGSIILLHDGGGDRSQTVAALPTLITTLQQRGYRFVTVPQLESDLGR